MFFSVCFRKQLMTTIGSDLEICPLSNSLDVKPGEVHSINNLTFPDMIQIPKSLIFSQLVDIIADIA